MNPQGVEATVVGEHGTSQVFLWSSARIGGRPISLFANDAGQSFDQFKKEIEQEVRYANITIIEGTGASVFGIGVVSARIAEIVLRDERAVIPIGSFNPDFGTTLSLPSVLGRNGVSRILMPEMSGLEVLQWMRRGSVPTPVLMLTARDAAADRVTGLDQGADDYLIKPFDFAELLARIRALQRRRKIKGKDHECGEGRPTSHNRKDGHERNRDSSTPSSTPCLGKRQPPDCRRHPQRRAVAVGLPDRPGL